MATINDTVENFINKLENDEKFKDIKISRAYPSSVKPTRLSKIVVCLSLDNVEGESIAIGQDCIYCDYTIAADVFVPFCIGSQAIDNVIKNVVNNFKTEFPISIKTSEIKVDKTTLCYIARCSLSFNDFIDGGAFNG